MSLTCWKFEEGLRDVLVLGDEDFKTTKVKEEGIWESTVCEPIGFDASIQFERVDYL